MSFTGAHGAKDMLLAGVRWSVASPLSARHGEDLMEDRGVSVDQATIQRWGVKDSPQLAEAIHRRKRSVGRSWRLDKMDIRVKGAWQYL